MIRQRMPDVLRRWSGLIGTLATRVSDIATMKQMSVTAHIMPLIQSAPPPSLRAAKGRSRRRGPGENGECGERTALDLEALGRLQVAADAADAPHQRPAIINTTALSCFFRSFELFA